MDKIKTGKYFLRKFLSINENKWIKDKLSNHKGAHCALGHCGVQEQIESEYQKNPEARALIDLFSLKNEIGKIIYQHRDGRVTRINDAFMKEYQDIHKNSPRQRIACKIIEIMINEKG